MQQTLLGVGLICLIGGFGGRLKFQYKGLVLVGTAGAVMVVLGVLL